MNLIDCHAHFFSRTFFEVLAGQSPHTERLPELLDSIGVNLPSTDPEEHTRRWITEMDHYGVDHMTCFASIPHEMHDVSLACSMAEGRLTGFAMIPANAPNALDLVDKARDLGFRGLLLFPVMHGYRVSDEAVAPIIARAAELGMILIVHCGILQIKLRTLLDMPSPFDLRFGNPIDVVVVANQHPSTTFIIPHFGGGFFRETLMAGAMCSNIFVDTSSSNDWVRTQPAPLALKDVFERALDVFGSSRILFGTDSCIFPRGWRNELHTLQVKALDDLGISENDCSRIFSGNARELLGISNSLTGTA